MIAIIPLSEKSSKKRRTITITKGVRLTNQEFDLLLMLSSNKYVHIDDMILRLYSRKTLDNRQYIKNRISRLRAYGVNIEKCRYRYKCNDEIFIK